MRRGGVLFLVLLLASIAGADGASGASNPKPQHIIIGLDLSKSNPLVANADYARRVAARVAPGIRNLPPRSIVMVRTFGVYDPTAQNLRFDKQISSLNRPEDVSYAVHGIVAGVPTLVAKGKLSVQMKTNIVPFLENMAEVVNCRKMHTTIILITDGIEDSSYAKLTTTKASLPPPADPLFQRCNGLEMLGIGVGANDPALTNHLRAEWAAWAKAAGFKTFLGLNDW